jgi:hypothetical protein
MSSPQISLILELYMLVAVAAIQFPYASYLFDIYLPTDSRNYDYGRWPRKTRLDLARVLHMSSSRKPITV